MPGGLHAAAVGAPVHQARRAEDLQKLQALACADVPVPPLLDLPSNACQVTGHE